MKTRTISVPVEIRVPICHGCNREMPQKVVAATFSKGRLIGKTNPTDNGWVRVAIYTVKTVIDGVPEALWFCDLCASRACGRLRSFRRGEE